MAFKELSVHDDSVGTGKVVATTVIVTAYGAVKIARDGDSVTPHGPPPHNAATIVATQSKVKVEGKAVCRHGDPATCGHTIDTTVNPLNLRKIFVADDI